jgi:hypothetical protein
LLTDFRFEDLFDGFQRLSGFELVDLPPSLLESLIEGIARTRELLERLPGIISLPIDHCYLPLGQAQELHLRSSDDRLHLVVIEGPQRTRPEVALCR